MDDEQLVPILKLFTGRTRRSIHRDCRLGRIPGARKFGRQWMIRLCDWRAWKAQLPEEATSLEALRKLGYAA